MSTEELGAATLAAALFPILDRLAGAGLGSALVREPDDSPAAHATVFWLALGGAGCICALVCAARPLASAWLPEPIIASLVAAYGGKLVVQVFALVPEAQLKRDLRYRELSLVRIAANAVGTASKLGCAWLGAHAAGWGALRIWCFALGPIATTVAQTIGVQLVYPWRPRVAYVREVAARALRFTAALSGSELLYFAYTSADYLVVGIAFGDAAVGAYRLAYELVLDVVRLVSLVTAEVAFPTFALIASAADPRALGAQLLRFTRQNAIALAPFVVFVALEADDLLAALYPGMPAAAATAARILCIVGGLRTLGFVLPPLLAATGRASRVLAYEAAAAIVLPLGFVLAASLARDAGFVAVAWAWALGDPLALAVLLAMALPAAHVGLRTYGRALGKIGACALGAAAAGGAARACVGTALPGAVRAIVVGASVIAAYLPLLAWLERVTPAAVVRSFRARPGDLF